MPAKRKNPEIKCEFYAWLLVQRGGVFYADGRVNDSGTGRTSLGTRDRKKALRLIHELDRTVAERDGLVEPEFADGPAEAEPVTIKQGRHLYEQHAKRPRAIGGVKLSTWKRYRAVFDKFEKFCHERGIAFWNAVDDRTIESYAGWLEKTNKAPKTIRNEVTTLKQAFKHLCDAGHLPGRTPLNVKLPRIESQSAYCWTPEEVAAMAEHTEHLELPWLRNPIILLANTGMRISEAADLEWRDVDFDKGFIILTDESGHSGDNKRTLKSGRSRMIPIHDELADLLSNLPKTSRRVLAGQRGGKLKADTFTRCLRRDILTPLAERFPTQQRQRGFINGTAHSFRHYFCSVCANRGVPERVLMQWLGHADSEMVRRCYHLHDAESRRQMSQLSFVPPAAAALATENPCPSPEEREAPERTQTPEKTG